jgi:hypothetical protein
MMVAALSIGSAARWSNKKGVSDMANDDWQYIYGSTTRHRFPDNAPMSYCGFVKRSNIKPLSTIDVHKTYRNCKACTSISERVKAAV